MAVEGVSVGEGRDAPRAAAGAGPELPAEGTAQGAAATPDAGAAEDAGGFCVSCGAGLAGKFCHACGEKRVGARDLTVRHFVSEALQEFTSVEHSKIFRTARALLFRPGFLTREWIAGRRNLYLKPLNLCLVIFGLNLFVYSAYKQVSMFDFGRIAEQQKSMVSKMELKGGDLMAQMVDGAAARRRVTREEIYEDINARWHRYFSFLQVPEIFVFALLLQILYIFSRRHFVEHLVFSFHFLSFTSLTVVMMWPVYFFMGVAPTVLNMLIAVAKFVLDIVYLFVAQRVVYRESAAKALLRAPVVFVGYFVIYAFAYTVAMLAAFAAAVGR